MTSAVQKTETAVWRIFLVWTLVGAAVMPFEIGDVAARALVANPGLQTTVVYLLSIFDAVWMVLAASVVYLFALSDLGRNARIWAGIILLGSALIEGVGAKTGWPFGPFAYTDNLGVRLFGVLPFTIPLVWMVVLFAARYAVLRWDPFASRLKIALGAGVIALLTDLNLEFVAWKVRTYWIWYPPGSGVEFNSPGWPPLQNYISWFVVSFLLVLVLPGVRQTPGRDPLRPVLVLVAMNALFLFVHAVRFVRFGGY